MTVLVIAEHDNQALKGATLNAVTAAQKIGGDIHVAVIGSGVGAVARTCEVAQATICTRWPRRTHSCAR